MERLFGMVLTLLRRCQRSLRQESAPIPVGAGALDCVVLDPVRLPLHRADVVVRDMNSREIVRGQTDPHGRFAATVTPGEYSVAVTAEGFQPLRHTVEAAEGARTALGPMAMEPAPAPVMPAAGAWRIDPDHSAVRFISRHIGLAEVHGRFNRFEGGLWVGERMEDSRVHVTIETASIDTGVAQRDD
ncbi:YceI family protein [Streptomyces sp. NPDC049577]|uniref:YceI family protein n=1 Tax=Streptomyces sp. NPDC049577 TaxID=3155153 RepID=UPI0034316AE3